MAICWVSEAHGVVTREDAGLMPANLEEGGGRGAPGRQV